MTEKLCIGGISKLAHALFCRRTGYKLKTAPIPIVLLDYTEFENHNAPPSKRALHCLLFHWLHFVCHPTLLAPSRYD
jgi:hypothetical protein